MAGEKPPHVKVFRCPSCGGEVQVRAPGHSVTAVCLSCGSAIDVSNESLKIIAAATKAYEIPPHIAIGRRGKLFGAVYEIIGYLVRCDHTEQWFWGEYLLFNPMKGFRWLVEFDGHWNYVIPTRGEAPSHTSDGWADYLGQSYRLFHKGRSKVKYVLGEFYWRVKAGDSVRVEDYVKPPEMLSLEADDKELMWSIAKYVEAKDIARAFHLSEMPETKGVAPNQPSTMSDTSSPMLGAFVLLLGLSIAIQLYTTARARQALAQTVRLTHISTPEATPDNRSATFTLDGGTENVGIDLYSPVDNAWLEAGGELVNEDTQEEYPFEVGVEYWHGYDPEDGNWTEGSSRGDAVVSSVPPGKYHLRFATSASLGDPKSYEITVLRDVPSWSNFLLVILLLFLPPAFCVYLSHRFERRRWSTSDFNPYWTSEDDD